jgi:transcriptional regulator with XRE-family HTH domain
MMVQQRDQESFGTLLQRYRLRAGLAQNALARVTTINVGTVNRLERDQRMPATRQQVLAIAGALGLTTFETNRLLDAAGLPAEGFNSRITANPAICGLVDLLQDDSIPSRDRDDLISMVQRYVDLVARANGRLAHQ